MNNYYRIEEICKIKGGKRIPAGESLQKEKNDHPYIRIVDMYQGRIIEKNSSIVYAKENYLNKIKNYTVNSNDIILAIVGNTLGMVSTIGHSLNGANLTENCCKFVDIDTSRVIPMFLYYSLIYPLNQRTINKFKVGSSQPKLPMYNICNLLVPKFNIEKQKYVVDILSNIDNKIENNNKINVIIESIIDKSFNKWFVEYNFIELNQIEYRNNGGKMVYSKELDKYIPENWIVLKTKERFNYIKGIEPGSENYTSTKEKNVKFYRVGDMDDSGNTYISNKFLDFACVEPNDVLVSFDGTVGKIGVGLSGVYSTGMKKIKDSKNIIDNSVIFAMFRSVYFQKTINKYATGSNILHASSSIEYLNIAFNEEVFKKYAEYINPFYKIYVSNKMENQKLTEIKNKLLPILMSN